MDAENFYQVFDWLWTSGQLSERDIAALPALGVKSVINLAPPSSSNTLPGEAEQITGKGINYIQIPVPWEQPELYHFNLFCSILQTLHGEPTWVHCAKNMRVSVFIYLYRHLFLHEPEAIATFPLKAV